MLKRLIKKNSLFWPLQYALSKKWKAQPELEAFLPSPQAQASQPAELSFIPDRQENLLFLMAAKAVLAKRIRKGWYKDNLIILVTLEKSGSTFCEIVLREGLQRNHGTNAYYFPNFGSGGVLSPAGLCHFSYIGLMNLPDGGVFRGCFEPAHFNLRLMRELGCPVVILLRHPADRMIANICMRYRLLSDEGRKTISQVIEEVFSGHWDRQEALKRDDYFTSYAETLRWMAGWAELTHQHGFHIVRYEDMFFDTARALPALHRNLFGTDIAPEALKEAIALQARTHEGGDLQASRNNPHHQYPKGYTGKAGVWREYLNRDHVELCNRITEAFLAISPAAKRLQALYPDLRLDPAKLMEGQVA